MKRPFFPRLWPQFFGRCALDSPHRKLEKWLEEHLERWGPGIFLDRDVESKQPTKKEMSNRLVQITAAFEILGRALDDAPIREFLEADAEPIDGTLRSTLRVLIERATLDILPID